ncbi:MAG TPA: Ku protein, partial [Vicinamibacteria bacterium]|nr:Ku protein [Vicinamibacteria bacterium]
DKAYSLLADAMKDAGKAALAQYAARGKDYLVLLRSIGNRLMMQQLYHADEVRSIDEVPVPARKSSPAELKLAQQLIDQVSSEKFEPEKYTDEVRKRIEQLIAAKAKGQKIEAPAARPKAEVVDLMEALKKSLGQGGRRAPVRAARREQPARKTARR